METRERPASLLVACVLVIAALIITSGRTLWDVYDMARTRDELAMSGVLVEAVWCNVAIWIALGLPLAGAMMGWRYCRPIVAFIAALLIAVLLAMMRLGQHSINPWAISIVLLQVLGSVLLFVPTSNAYYRPRPAAA